MPVLKLNMAPGSGSEDVGEGGVGGGGGVEKVEGGKRDHGKETEKPRMLCLLETGAGLSESMQVRDRGCSAGRGQRRGSKANAVYVGVYNEIWDLRSVV